MFSAESLPENLKVTGYLESEGSDTVSETTFSQMVWKLKSDTGAVSDMHKVHISGMVILYDREYIYIM